MRYEKLTALPLEVEGYDLALRERDTSSEFTRATTVVSLHGEGKTGRGEDVTYENDHHYTVTETDPELPLAGSYTFESFSEHLGELDLFPEDDPEQSIFHNYRRWAFESAALDLALRQADTTLAARLDREYSPVEFVASTRLGDPPTTDRVVALLDRNPELGFKLDPTAEWTPELVDDLAETAVRILDLKGKYQGTDVDQEPDPALYELVLEGFPDAVIEDPNLTEKTRPVFEGHEHRVSWDYPIRGVDTVEDLPWEPDWLNIKPSRFGTVESLLATIEYCKERDIELYGGGQFELDVGRQQLHALASLFYPESPNDIAPMAYNEPDPAEDLPRGPLVPAQTEGFAWQFET